MIIQDNVDQIQDPMQHLWGLLTEIGEQQNQNRNLALSLHTKATDLKTQAIHTQNGFVLRRFNLDKSKEAYEAELSRMNAAMALENQSLQYDNKQLNTLIKDFETTLESVMSTFRNKAKEVQERELSLMREYETKLLQMEEEKATHELANNTAISESLSRLSNLLRQILKLQTGELYDAPLSAPPSSTDTPFIPEEEREPWMLAALAEKTLERDIELARLERENEELRRMLGIDPPLQRRQVYNGSGGGSNGVLHGGEAVPPQTGSSEHLPSSSDLSRMQHQQHKAQQGTRALGVGGSMGPFGTYKRPSGRV
ncbi:hypothetical protein ONZ45_g2386 [Pleurotus djamor]|nr:hypothetical protein ONZ45_g2386 [Pleurotus djamor]